MKIKILPDIKVENPCKECLYKIECIETDTAYVCCTFANYQGQQSILSQVKEITWGDFYYWIRNNYSSNSDIPIITIPQVLQRYFEEVFHGSQPTS